MKYSHLIIMELQKRTSFILSLWLLLFLCVPSFFTPALTEAEEITPERVITVIADQPAPPGWKILWDEARKKVQGKKIPDAAQLYRQLLALKPNIEAANWEYCKVLIKTGDFSSAAVVILPLLEKDPTRLDYLLTAGMISLRMEDYSAAFKQYGKVYEVDPGGIHSTVALKGMIESLKGAGNIGVALPLLEQLQSRQSNNRQLLYEIAADAEQLGKNEKARSYYKKILGSGPISQIDERIIFDAAGFFEKLNYQEDSVPLWQEYIRRNPGYLLFYKKLADYFMGKNDSKSALPYFHFLADNTEDNSQLLARIAEIYLYQVNRPDRALKFYEMYMKKNPADRKVLAEISNIQSTLAHDFLSIVENDGAVQLWGDLEKVTPNRPAIYLKMANLLGQKGKLPEQFEVLQILHDFRPQDDTITYRIVNNLRKRKEYAAALNYLNNVSPVHNKSKRYFLLKGNIEELQGKEVAALYSFISGLKADSDDFDLRRICISRAGALGLIKELGELFEEIPRNSHRKITIDFIINYFDQLAYNSLFTRLDRQYDHFLAVFKNDTVTRFKLQLHQAGTRRLCGKPKKAEALYRKLLNSHISDGEVLSLLAGNAIDDNKVDTARVWYKALSDIIESYSGSRAAEKADLVRKKTLLDARFMLAAGDSQGAAYSIDQLKKSFKTGTENRSSARVVSLLEQELCWLYIEKEEFSEYRSLAKELTKGDRFIPDISAIENILKIKPAEKAVENINQPSLFIGKRPVMSRFIQVAQVEIKHGEYDSADRHLHAVLKRSSHSLVTRVLRAELMSGKGNLLQSSKFYNDIHAEFPEEQFFERKIIEIDSNRGMYKDGLNLLYAENIGFKQADNLQSYNGLNADFEEIVLLARMLWGDRQLEKSLKIYELLLYPPVIELLGNRFEMEDIYYLYFSREKSFWNSLLLLLQTEPEIVTELMAAPFLIDNIGNKTGDIVVEYYELYSWQKLLQNEYLARKAIAQRKYEEAKRNYKRLFDEGEESNEGLRDLASIYDRFGEYRKEAQVYEKLRNKGEETGELVGQMEKTSMKLRPHTGLDGGILKKSGRSGYVNLENSQFGTSLLYTPDLEKEVKFQFFRNNYGEVDGDKSISGTFMESSGTVEILSDIDILFSGAAERLDGRSGTNFYYSLGLQGQLDDYFNSYAEIYRNKIDDTLDAVIDGVNSDGFEIGLTGETPGGIIVGGDYRHRYYSDGNAQNRFHAFSSYRIYRESIHIGLKYDYYYLNNSDRNEEIEDVVEEGESNGALYWKPPNYSDHEFTLHFKQLIKGNYGEDDLLSYYTFDNSIGFEDPQNVLYTGKFDIFLEMSPHYLLKGNFLFANSKEYEEVSFLLSLYYRW